MTKEAYDQMMAGLKEAENQFLRTVFPDCTAKYYAVKNAIELIEENELSILPTPVSTKIIGTEHGDVSVFCCGNCRMVLDPAFHYCPNCGEPIGWNEEREHQ